MTSNEIQIQTKSLYELLKPSSSTSNLENSTIDNSKMKSRNTKNSKSSNKKKDKKQEKKIEKLSKDTLSQESEFEGFSNSQISIGKDSFFVTKQNLQQKLEKSYDENSPSPGRLIIDEESSSSLSSKNKLNDDVSKKETKIDTNSNKISTNNTVKEIFLHENRNLIENLNERSPDLFDIADDDDNETNFDNDRNNLVNDYDKKIEDTINNDESIVVDHIEEELATRTSLVSKNIKNIKNSDKELLKRIKDCLSGVPPPPSVTISQIDILNVVIANKENIFNFYKELKELSSKRSVNSEILEENFNNQENQLKISLFKPTHSLEEIEKIAWPDILNVKQHGLW